MKNINLKEFEQARIQFCKNSQKIIYSNDHNFAKNSAEY